jgi:ATP-dependent Clp protease adaptor protein ClpS
VPPDGGNAAAPAAPSRAAGFGRKSAIVGGVARRASYAGAVTIAPEKVARSESDERVDPDRPWVTIVWNDPINLMTYVTYVLQKLFGYSKEKATKLMLDVHHKGRAVVSSGAKEQMEFDVARLHAAGLWATLQQD